MEITINGRTIRAPEGSTIMEAAHLAGIYIPNLCYDPRLGACGDCGLCVVEVEGRGLVKACETLIEEGMAVWTETPGAVEERKAILRRLLANHPVDCLICPKLGACELQKLCMRYGVTEGEGERTREVLPLDDTNPFYYSDPNKCVACGKCVNVCERLQCERVLSFVEKDGHKYVSPPYGKTLGESGCVSCGNCVSVCPVGALMPKTKEVFRYWETRAVRTTCSYCGVGCQIDLLVKDNKIVDVRPAYGPSNKGLLCVKGKFGHGFVNSPDRLKKPLVRKNGRLEEVSWDEALNLIVEKLKEIKEKYGPDAIAAFSSARSTVEENYLMQKFMRAVIGTNNIDHCARLCHASTVAGLATTLGSGAMTNSIEEILGAEVIFAIGSNTTECHPVIAAQVRQAVARGAKLIVADSRDISLRRDAAIYLKIKPGTNIALINAMINVILEEGLEDREYIEKYTEGFEELAEVVKKYTPERVAQICGVRAEDIREAARLYAATPKATILYCMGVTQHVDGTENVMAVSNLALVTGHLGKESTGVNPLRGQNNVQGACDMGALPNVFPGYQPVTNPEVREKFEKFWGVPLSGRPGLTIPEVMHHAEHGDIKVLYIMGENPLVSDPDTRHVEKALKKVFLIVQDIFLTETAEFAADVVLPAACFAEKEGTFVNTERRVQRVRKAVEPPGEAKADWEIIAELMRRFGYKADYRTPEDIFEEIRRVTPQYAGITYKRLDREGSLQWPCPSEDHPGTRYLHAKGPARGKGLLKPVEYKEHPDIDEEHSLILTTGRILYHYHTRTMTAQIEGINKVAPENYVEINPKLAASLGIQEGEWVRVISKRGEAVLRARITDRVEENVIFIPFHWAYGANLLTSSTLLDPYCKIPSLKVSGVRIEKVS